MRISYKKATVLALREKQGFTLLEMSMVLVIIGLILGGILVTRDMIRASQLQQTLGQYDRFVKAIKEFTDKYQALPGDMKNAESMWGSDAGCPMGTWSAGAKRVTCNGDGDGRIGEVSIAADSTTTQSINESFHAWQQLANAGMIEGNFSGYGFNNDPIHSGIDLIYQNVPIAAVKGGSWVVAHLDSIADNTLLWGGQYGHVLMLDAGDLAIDNPYDLSELVPVLPPLTVAEAMQIDNKIDDGKPGTGSVRAWRTVAYPNCIIENSSAQYALYNKNYIKNTACGIFFILGL